MFVIAAFLFVSVVDCYVMQFSQPVVRKSVTTSRSQLSMAENIWNEQVEYVDLNANNLEPSPTSRTLPLFLLGKELIKKLGTMTFHDCQQHLD